MTSVRKKGTTGRIALSCAALGTAMALSPAAAALAVTDEPGPAATAAPTEPVAGQAIGIDDTHLVVVPDDASYAFLGAPGTRVWETEEPVGTAGLTLTGVEGPGALVIHRAGEGTGPEPLAHSGAAEGLPEDGYAIPPRTEGVAGPVARWAFTAPGTYLLTLADPSAEHDPVRRTTTLTVRVGNGAVAASPLPLPAPGEPVPPVTGEPGSAPQPSGTATPSLDQPVRTKGAQSVQARVGAPRAAQAPATTKAATEKKVLAEGHLDIAARVVDGKLQIQVKDGTVAGKTTWREPSSVVLHIKSAAKKQIPAGDTFSFLGKAGDPIWLLDQVQQEGLLWPGWSTDNVEAGALKGGVKFGLTKADGPGGFALYTYDGLSGASVLFNSKDGVPDTIDVPANTHAHGGWAFRGEGVHRLTLSMTGTLANGSASTDTETVTFVVGDKTDPGSVSPSGGASGTGGSSTGPDGKPGPDGGTSASAGTGEGSGNSGQGNGSSGQGNGTSGSMASTGAEDVVLMGGGAVALAAAGTALVVLNRRREQRNGARA
ncbi:TIGR03773 family transporter-associated surface protein [Streptomyces roseoviridis]|uniref:TIGR03773 family transporter-associated surface protein n=1 Tax=Streptomyces roseoviridis TaxID=67361 RepID=A0ABV5QTH2_9ACTN